MAIRPNKLKETAGDVFRINITPPGDTFPWVKIFRHKFGIRGPGREVKSNIGPDEKTSKSREQLAIETGEKIIENSKVLKKWFKESK